MKKFIVEILLIISLVLAVCYWLYQWDNSFLVRNIHDIDEPIDLVHLGGSHSANFNYQTVNIEAARFNKAANTLYYDLQNYKFLIPNLNDSAIICIPISFMSFGLEENREDRGESFVNDFYHYLPSEFIYGYRSEKRAQVIAFQIQKNFKLLTRLERDKSQPKPKRLKVKATKEQRIEEKDDHLYDLSVKRVKHHMNIFDASKSELNNKYLDELLRLTKNLGHQPILISVPYYSKYTDQFDSLWLNEHYYNNINIHKDRYGIHFLDYSKDERFMNDPLLFKDPDHLSGSGKKLFNQIFWNDMVALGYLKPEQLIAESKSDESEPE